MRVIAGTAGGRPLRSPRGHRTRPTADRVREALFSSLGAELAGARVLDLFAGSGALGIEALSRGAAWATFVERDPKALAVVAANLASTGLASRASVVRGEAARFCAEPRGGPFDLVFCDPPYEQPLATVVALVERLGDARGLAPGARVVFERDRRDSEVTSRPELGRVLVEDRRRSYGDTVLLYLRADIEGLR